jgi:hypothetical protein
MVDVQRDLDDELIAELHPEWGHPDWVEWTAPTWEQAKRIRRTCAFCGREVLDGYYNRRTEKYSCQVQGDYDAVMAYAMWLEENTFDMEEEEE